ncbi:choice-of-anchor P family protein [Actinomadura welshii]
MPQGEGSAYGLTASGPVSVPPVPAVSSTTETVRKSLLREESTDLVKASALDVSASAARARSTVAKAAVPAADLMADAVTAKCRGGHGSAHLARAVIAGKRLDASPPPNTTIPVDVEGVGRTSLTLNKQERMADGRLAVTAMELRLPLPGKPATIRIASATCGKSGPAEQPADAPAPTPVEHDLPVTG